MANDNDQQMRRPKHQVNNGLAKPVAYLTSYYPAVSHTFIRREVNALREIGVAVHTFGIQPVEAPDVLAPIDQAEIATTKYILSRSKVSLALLLARAFGAHPQVVLAVAVAAFRSVRGVRRRVWQLFYVAEATILQRWMAKANIKHVHAHFANAPTDVARWTAAVGNGVSEGWTWSFTMHGPTELYAVEEHGLGAKLANADAVACISDFCRSQMMMFSEPSHWNKFKVVHCGITPSAFPIARGSSDGVFTIVCVGRLVPEKGQAVLLAAAERLRSRGVVVRLVFVGSGKSQEWLESETARTGINAVFLGAIGQDEVTAVLLTADAMALASFAEGVPVVLMEAMACGLPVVATRIAGIQELVDDGVSGFVVAPGRDDLLADALGKLVRDPDNARAMGRAGRAKVSREFDVNDAAAALAQMFADVSS